MCLINYRNIPGSSKVFRTGNIGDISTSDCNWLKENQITTYVDLRSHNEFCVNSFCTNREITYKCFDVDNSHDSYLIEKPFSEHYVKYYLQMLETCKSEIKKFFMYLGFTKDERIVYGCSLGKDRTGVFTYLLLSFMGIEYDQIKEDYIKSVYELASCALVTSYYNKLGKNDYKERLEASQDCIDVFNKKFIEKYSCVDSYLKSIGMKDFERIMLYEKKEKYFDLEKK